jgi:hypothetical protein
MVDHSWHRASDSLLPLLPLDRGCHLERPLLRHQLIQAPNRHPFTSIGKTDATP